MSKTMAVSSPARCRARPDLISTPSCAPRPVPAMMDVGVASPMAQGQAMTSTETAMRRAKEKPSSLKIYQERPASRASDMTVGTK